MKWRLIALPIFVSFVVLVYGKEPDPALALQSFYSWYVHELTSGSMPLNDHTKMREFATARLLQSIGSKKTPDPFLNATQIDSGWGQNIAVASWYVGKSMSKVHLFLTGKKYGDRQIELKLLMEEGRWKIDEIKFLD